MEIHAKFDDYQENWDGLISAIKRVIIDEGYKIIDFKERNFVSQVPHDEETKIKTYLLETEEPIEINDDLEHGLMSRGCHIRGYIGPEITD